jgi:hypothetical protein
MNIASVTFWQSSSSAYDNIVGAPLLLVLLRSTPNLQPIITYFYAGSERRQGLRVGSQAVFALTSAINEGEDNI